MNTTTPATGLTLDQLVDRRDHLVTELAQRDRLIDMAEVNLERQHGFSRNSTQIASAETRLTHRTLDREATQLTLDSVNAAIAELEAATAAAALAAPAAVEAAQLIREAYAVHGRCTLSCSACLGSECYIDGDAIGCGADATKVAALIEHARYGHAGAADVVATVTSTMMKVTR